MVRLTPVDDNLRSDRILKNISITTANIPLIGGRFWDFGTTIGDTQGVGVVTFFNDIKIRQDTSAHVQLCKWNGILRRFCTTGLTDLL